MISLTPRLQKKREKMEARRRAEEQDRLEAERQKAEKKAKEEAEKELAKEEKRQKDEAKKAHASAKKTLEDLCTEGNQPCLDSTIARDYQEAAWNDVRLQ